MTQQLRHHIDLDREKSLWTPAYLTLEVLKLIPLCLRVNFYYSVLYKDIVTTITAFL